MHALSIHVRRPLAGNTDAPPRPPPSLVAGPALSLVQCTSPTREHSRSCRSCRTSYSPTKPSSPGRTRRSDTTAVVSPRQGPNCNLGLCIRVPYARNRGPLCETLLLFQVCKASNFKICRKLYKIQKNTKLVLLESLSKIRLLLFRKFEL
jgi:hypothetical protein